MASRSSGPSPSTAGTSVSRVRRSITMPRLVASSFQRDCVMSSESRTTWLRSSGHQRLVAADARELLQTAHGLRPVQRRALDDLQPLA